MTKPKRQKLTNTYALALEPRPNDYQVYDTEVPNLYVRIRPAGSKTWGVSYRTAEGRQKRTTLGKVGILSPKDAREQAREMLVRATKGEDPNAAKKERRQGETMYDLWEAYLERHARPHKRPRSVQEDEGNWRRNIAPQLANERVSSVTRSEITKLLANMSDTPRAANHTRALLSKMFALSVEWGMREDNPCDKTKRYKTTGRDTHLTQTQAHRLYEAAEKDGNAAAGMIVRLAIVTGARKGEILTMQWAQLTLDAAAPTWTLQATETKQKKINLKPLTDTAASLLREWRDRSNSAESPYVFPMRGNPSKPRTEFRKPWERIKSAAGLDAELPDFHFHDIRHTFAFLTLQAGRSLAELGAYLGHTDPSTTQRYAHWEVDHLRGVAEAIPDFTQGTPHAATVVPLQKRN